MSTSSASPTCSPAQNNQVASATCRPRANYAYLTRYYEPECDRGGIQIVDISDPANPKPVGLVPSHVGTLAGEGSQVVTLNTPAFKGDVLIYQNEICPGFDNIGIGGVTLLDVTNPLKPKKLVEGYGDFTNNGKSQTHANQVHSAFGWTKTETGRTYVIMTDDEELTDTDIIDITNPSKPTWVAEYDAGPSPPSRSERCMAMPFSSTTRS